MALEMNSDSTVCFKCGRRYSGWKGYFHVSYALLYKGGGHLTICKTCVDKMYNEYLAQCGNSKDAVRQMCRKLDIFWSESVFEAAMQKSGAQSVMAQYIAKTNSTTYAGKSYDDTLLKEGTLWGFREADKAPEPSDESSAAQPDGDNPAENDPEFERYIQELTSYPVTKDVIAFWGTGYTKQMYAELEQRRAYWMSRFSQDFELDAGTEALIRQICSLELDINRDRADGKSVDKSTNALNNLLGSANLKPVQKKEAVDDFSKQPLGVKLYHREKNKPLPELEESEKDRRHIKKYIFTWVLGHLCKMCGVKNGYTKLYDEAIRQLRVELPQYEDESDEDLIIHSFEDLDIDMGGDNYAGG